MSKTTPKITANRKYLESLVSEVMNNKDQKKYNLNVLLELDYLTSAGTVDTATVIRQTAMRWRAKGLATEEELERLEKAARAHDEGGLVGAAMVTLFGIVAAGIVAKSGAAAVSSKTLGASASNSVRSMISRAGDKIVNTLTKYRPPPSGVPNPGITAFGRTLAGPSWTSFETIFGIKLLAGGLMVAEANKIAEEVSEILGIVDLMYASSKEQFVRNQVYDGNQALMAVENIKIDNSTHEKKIKEFISLYSEYKPRNYSGGLNESLDASNSYDPTQAYTGWTVPRKIINSITSKSTIESFSDFNPNNTSLEVMRSKYLATYRSLQSVGKMGTLGIGGRSSYLLVEENLANNLIEKMASENIFFHPQYFAIMCFKYVHSLYFGEQTQNLIQVLEDLNEYSGINVPTLSSAQESEQVDSSIGVEIVLGSNSVPRLFKALKAEFGDDLATNEGLKEDLARFVSLINLDPGGKVMTMSAVEACEEYFKAGMIEQAKNSSSPGFAQRIIAAMVFHAPEEAVLTKTIDTIKNRALGKRSSKLALKSPGWSMVLSASFWALLYWIDPFNKIDRKKIIEIFEKCLRKAERYREIQYKESRKMNENVMLAYPGSDILIERPEFMMFEPPSKEQASDEYEKAEEEKEERAADEFWEFTDKQVEDVLRTFFDSFVELTNEIQQAVSETWSWKKQVDKLKAGKDRELDKCSTYLDRANVYQELVDLQTAILVEFKELSEEDLSGAINSDNYESFIESLKSTHKKVLESFDKNKIADLSLQLKEQKVRINEQNSTSGPAGEVQKWLIAVRDKINDKSIKKKLNNVIISGWDSNFQNVLNDLTIGENSQVNIEQEDIDGIINENDEQIMKKMKDDYNILRRSLGKKTKWKKEHNNEYTWINGAYLKMSLNGSRLATETGSEGQVAISGDETLGILGMSRPLGFDNWILKSNCWGSFIKDFSNYPASGFHRHVRKLTNFNLTKTGKENFRNWKNAHRRSSAPGNIRSMNLYGKNNYAINTDEKSYFTIMTKKISKYNSINASNVNNGVYNQIIDLIDTMHLENYPGWVDPLDTVVLQNKENIIGLLTVADKLRGLQEKLNSYMWAAKRDLDLVLTMGQSAVNKSEIVKIYKDNNTIKLSRNKNQNAGYVKPAVGNRIAGSHYNLHKQNIEKEQKIIDSYLLNFYKIAAIDQFLTQQLGNPGQ